MTKTLKGALLLRATGTTLPGPIPGMGDLYGGGAGADLAEAFGEGGWGRSLRDGVGVLSVGTTAASLVGYLGGEGVERVKVRTK